MTTSGSSYIVSIALSSSRLRNVRKIVSTFYYSTKKPRKIYFFVSKEPFFLDKGIEPQLLEKLKRLRNVEFIYTDNIGLMRRHIPILKMYWNEPETKILLWDDDIIPHDNLTNLICYFSDKYPNVSIGTYGYLLKPNGKMTKFSAVWPYVRVNVIVPEGGILIKPKFFFDSDVFNWEKYINETIDPRISNEVLTNYCMAKKDIERIIVGGRNLPTRIRQQELVRLTHHKKGYYKKRVEPSKNDQKRLFYSQLTKGLRNCQIIKQIK